MELTKAEILNLDSRLFSPEDKKAYIELLYGNPEEWTWKKDLESTAVSLRRWNGLLSPAPVGGKPYEVSQRTVMYNAKNRVPQGEAMSVSDFTDWIYRLYIPIKDYASLARGRKIERVIARQRIPIPTHGRWKLIHNGMGEKSSNSFVISSLLVINHPLYGSPDLVFQEKGTGRILIVEIKVTEAKIPADGWPNLRAQLWAYSQIDAWINAPEILLVGEIWGFKLGIQLRKTLHWKREDELFQKDNSELFHCFRSHMESRVNSVCENEQSGR